MKRSIFTLLLLVFLLTTSFTYADGLLPTLANTYGIAMPSLTEALGRYPKSEEILNGVAVEYWVNISEEDFESFGIYLKKSGAMLLEYQVEDSMFTATLAKDEGNFTFVFDTEKETAVVMYPSGVYDERLFAIKSVWNAAEALETAEQYVEAAEKYASLVRYENAVECYRDSDIKELECYYHAGERKRASQDWESAVTDFTRAGIYRDAAIQIIETYYQHAYALLEKGEADEAYVLFKSISGYKDVDNLLNNQALLVAERKSEARAAYLAPLSNMGSYFSFGSYEQDNNMSNGKEPIEWIVLRYDQTNNRALLISRYGLDVKPYDANSTSDTWESCTLRSWLNETFLNAAFTEQEQNAIMLVNVDNYNEGYYRWRNSGSTTQDKIFLLSYVEASDYFGVTEEDHKNMKSRLTPTAYALQAGAYVGHNKTSDGAISGWWWLRSSGRSNGYAANIDPDGSLICNKVTSLSGCVRPVFWFDLESDFY